MFEGSFKNTPSKTLSDILDRDALERKAMIHWTEMSAKKRKKKGYKYNQVLKGSWLVQESFEWLNDYFTLQEVQKRLLLKKELINAYNNLATEDRILVNQYLNIREQNSRWMQLTSEEKKQLIKAVFNFF